MFRLLFVLAPLWFFALPMLGGCSATFENVLTTSLQGDRAFVSSLYGPIGITSELRKADADELKRLRAKGKTE